MENDDQAWEMATERVRKARASGDYVPADDVIRRLERMLADAKE